MDEWLGAWQSMYQPFKTGKSGKTAGAKKKGGGEQASAVAEGQAAIAEFSRHWAEAQATAARKWWEVVKEMSNLPAWPVAASPEPAEAKGGFWEKWLSGIEGMWPESPYDSSRFLSSYADWFKMWNGTFKRLSEASPLAGKYFSPDIFRSMLNSYIGLFPSESWKAMLDTMQQALQRNVAFWNEADLPFDEMAAFMDKMLVRFTPLEDTQLFTLGAQANQYLEILANPFFAISGSPQLLEAARQGRNVQFHYLSFIIKNAELRGKVLEASLAAWPETMNAVLEEMEAEKAAMPAVDIYSLFISRLEGRVSKLMESEPYTRIQNELSEIGVRLKASIDAWFELLFSGLPILTKADEDDIAKELEALRVKVRKLSQEQKKESREKLASREAMN